MLDVVVLAVDTTVTGGGGAGVAVCDGVTAVVVPDVAEPGLWEITAAEATGTATAPAIPRAPTVLIAPAKMMLRRLFFMVLAPFRNNLALVVLTIQPESRLGRSVRGRNPSGYLYPARSLTGAEGLGFPMS